MRGSTFQTRTQVDRGTDSSKDTSCTITTSKPVQALSTHRQRLSKNRTSIVNSMPSPRWAKCSHKWHIHQAPLILFGTSKWAWNWPRLLRELDVESCQLEEHGGLGTTKICKPGF
ncbi:hypothetical protein KC19_2G191700 [Ceratodon purpureus]|uniref:Uncharacterized protein n=1 Tax=Ceratodon purpureus TaxID=3225 RepID=A0A8T0IZK5_CERPU|nr:hypothetical protein KC19_2G191700 [Ceratodon purpureus]